MADPAAVHPLVKSSAESAWRMKELGLAEHPHYDICPVVDFYVDDKLVLTAVPDKVSRDNALAIIDIGCGPIQPNLVCLSVDAHVTHSMINPATGEKWEPGEMQAACDIEGACATGLLTDCISTIGMFSDGRTHMMQRRYADHSQALCHGWSPTTLIPNLTQLTVT